MENNNQNPETGSKGTFPVNNTLNQGVVDTTQPVQNISQPSIKEVVESAVDPESAKTYIKLETKNMEGQVSGVLEIDLISFRERGQESRYLSINTIGSSNAGEQSETKISIDNEEDFNRFKRFISELNWND